MQKYLSQILIWGDRWRIKKNPGKTQLINFSQRKVICETSITIYVQPLKITPSVKFLEVIANSHLNVKLYLEHTKRACLLGRKNITRLYSTNVTLLIHLYKVFLRLYIFWDRTALNKTQIHRLEIIQVLCLHYVKKNSWSNLNL